jgi:hypothetical protein
MENGPVVMTAAPTSALQNSVASDPARDKE